MVSFQKKKISAAPTLGDILKNAREKTKYSLAETGRQLGITPKYLEALEKNLFNLLPGPVYTKNFIKKYAEFLKINSEELLNHYAAEAGRLSCLRAASQKRPSWPARFFHLGNMPDLLRRILVLTVIAALLIYLGLSLRGIFSPPPLFLEKPAEGTISQTPSVWVAGKTLPETRVQINGREAISNLIGNFEEEVTLRPGLNVITVIAIKKHGRTATIIRNVIYHQKNSP